MPKSASGKHKLFLIQNQSFPSAGVTDFSFLEDDACEKSPSVAPRVTQNIHCTGVFLKILSERLARVSDAKKEKRMRKRTF